jgi:hypothetical protein
VSLRREPFRILFPLGVGAHVTFSHTGREALACSRPWPIALVAPLTIGATIARASAERLASRYVETLGLAGRGPLSHADAGEA